MTTTASSPFLGSVRSADVDLFYRRFGYPGATPLLILHGANYYASRDWVHIATRLAGDREVCAFDSRGYGQSGWSPRQDYSLDAHLHDIQTLLDHMGWEQAVLIGHSRGGSHALRFSHEYPQRVIGLVLVDFSPGQTPGRRAVEHLPMSPWGPVYESLEQAHAATSRNPDELASEAGRRRVEAIFGQVDAGWVNVRRDPAYQSQRPSGRPDWSSVLPPVDLWDALAGLVHRGRPSLVIRATESTAYDAAALLRLHTDFAPVQLMEVRSGHDIPGTSPAELVGAVRQFLHRPPAETTDL